MRRSEVREVLFKILFRAEFNDISEMPDQIQYFFNVDTEVDGGKISEEDQGYISKREQDIINHLSEIDAAITDKVTGWTIDRMGKVDVAVIRLAVYEIMFDDDIPVGVSINEAVELAKKYGRDESGSFVNGVLAKFAK